MAFFFTSLLSDIYLSIGDSTAPGKNLRFFKMSHMLFPFDHTSAYKYGHVLLRAGYETRDAAIILESIDWFKKAASRNPFHYYSHYYLGKSYLFYNYPNTNYFNEAILEFKKAALIRGSNQTITLDTCKILLSLWPFLSDDDKQFCQDLLSQSMNRFLWDDFEGIVESWWLYSKEKGFLEQLLGKKPAFYYPVAEKLTELNAPLSLRWEFLAKYEKFLLEDVSREYQSLSFEKKYESDTLLTLLENLRTIKSYYKMAKDETFDEIKYHTFKSKLLRDVVAALFEELPNKKNQNRENQRQIDRYAREYIESDLPRDQVLEFKKYLEKQDFFNSNDFTSLNLKYLLEFKLGNLSDVISGIERLKSSISYININQQGGYIQLLLLLADSYEASRLLSVAEKTLKEIIDKQPDNLGACFRLLRIQQVIGEDKEYMEKIKKSIDSLKNSRKFELNPVNIDTAIEKPVYLVDNNSIEITFADHLTGEINTKVIQVFVDGRIKYENYISLLPGVIQVEIKPGPGEEEMSKHRVEVRVNNKNEKKY